MKTRAGDCGRLHPAGPTTRVLRRLPLSVTGTASEGGPPWADDASKLQALAQLLGCASACSSKSTPARRAGPASRKARPPNERFAGGAARRTAPRSESVRVRPSPSESLPVHAGSTGASRQRLYSHRRPGTSGTRPRGPDRRGPVRRGPGRSIPGRVGPVVPTAGPPPMAAAHHGATRIRGRRGSNPPPLPLSI